MTKFDLTPVIDVRAADRDRFSIPRQTLMFGPRPRIKNINPIADRKIERDDPYCPFSTVKLTCIGTPAGTNCNTRFFDGF